MSAYFIFELKSSLKPERVQKSVYDLWVRSGNGWDVDVYPHEKNGTLVCNLLYYFPGDTECRDKVERILDCLFSVAIDGRVYYYRFNEAIDMYQDSSQEVTLDHLLGDYSPTLGGYCLRHKVVRSQIQPRHNNLNEADPQN